MECNDLTILRIEQGNRFVPNYEISVIAYYFLITTNELLGKRGRETDTVLFLFSIYCSRNAARVSAIVAIASAPIKSSMPSKTPPVSVAISFSADAAGYSVC